MTTGQWHYSITDDEGYHTIIQRKKGHFVQLIRDSCIHVYTLLGSLSQTSFIKSIKSYNTCFHYHISLLLCLCDLREQCSKLEEGGGGFDSLALLHNQHTSGEGLALQTRRWGVLTLHGIHTDRAILQSHHLYNSKELTDVTSRQHTSWKSQ